MHVPSAEIDTAVAEAQAPALAGKARIDASKGEITVIVPLDQDESDKLISCVKTPEAKAKVAEVVQVVREGGEGIRRNGQNALPSPLSSGNSTLSCPCSCPENGELFEFESTSARTPLAAQRQGRLAF